MSLFFAVFLQLALQFSPKLGNSILSNLLIFALFFIFSYYMSASPLDLYNVTEENEILGLMKNIFAKDSNSNLDDMSINNETIKDDLINAQEEKFQLNLKKKKINISIEKL